ncbi:phosphatase inhibitor-domain-containing protein [Epithele typhae]|uniref:phosphatase inhibitor-domain-containing protein n=1 Tax=Epithele typhae TaxID=378194 RepID=UPI0020074FF1|nr:phosphatase inhibitor-domain-containing protein [Epithele typhae]KAH9910128.1 phosphatase inhibitor-domain-containing protein [Epithele typhae]
MATRQARRPGAVPTPDGSRTIIVHDDQPREEDEGDVERAPVGALRLRGATRHRQRVVWREDVVDNEGAGKKKSKICCIYHKPREFDESSSDESSDSDSDSDADDGRARRRCNDHDHGDHDHGHGHGDHGAATRDPSGSGVVHELEDSDSEPNAYERAPYKTPKKTPHPHAHPAQQ